MTPSRPPSAPAPDPIDVSVVVPCWNGAARIGALLASLHDQTIGFHRMEVIVVDDGSSDDTAVVVEAFATRHPLMNLYVIRQKNGGVNAARNAGVQRAIGRYVSLLDDDEEAPPNHLERVVDLLTEREESPGMGGPYRLIGESPFKTCASCSIGEAQLPIAGRGPTERLLGGNMTIRRAVFDEVGPFDDEISGRGDETEWFARANRAFLYDESLFVWHRRDDMTLRRLLRTGYRQGKSVPLLHEKCCDTSWRPSLYRFARYLGHLVRARCMNGLLQASRELGAIVSWTGKRARFRRGG